MIRTRPLEDVKGLKCGTQADNKLVCYLMDKNDKSIDTYRDISSINLSDIKNIAYSFDDSIRCYLELSKHKKDLVCEKKED